MTTGAEQFAAAANTLVGSPFRLHGRDPRTGLDCVGVVATCLAAIGRPAPVPQHYTLRHTDVSDLLGCLDQTDFALCEGPIEAGDLLLTRPGPGQFHLLIAVNASFCIHAHAGIGRVVVAPLAQIWPIERKWRLRVA